MSYLIRASFRLPYEPYATHRDLIKNLLGGNQWLQMVTGGRLLSVMQSYGNKENGLAAARSLGQGLQQILDCDLVGTVHVTELGVREDVPVEFLRRKKAESVKKLISNLQLVLSFSASFGPKGGVGEYGLTCDGEKVFVQKGVQLPLATSVHEAVYDCLDVALVSVIAYCNDRGLQMPAEPLALVSPSQTVIRQLRGEWKIEASSLIDRAMRCQQMLSNFDRASLSMHMPSELRAA